MTNADKFFNSLRLIKGDWNVIKTLLRLQRWTTDRYERDEDGWLLDCKVDPLTKALTLALSGLGKTYFPVLILDSKTILLSYGTIERFGRMDGYPTVFRDDWMQYITRAGHMKGLTDIQYATQQGDCFYLILTLDSIKKGLAGKNKIITKKPYVKTFNGIKFKFETKYGKRFYTKQN